MSPGSTPPQVHEAEQAWERGQWSRAAHQYRAAIAEDADRADLHYRLGRCLEKLKEWEAAAQAYQDAIARDPRRARWHYRLGRVLERSRDLLGAAQAYRTADRRSADRPAGGRWARKRSMLPYAKQIELSLLPRSEYAYCVRKGALLAKDLGLPAISVLEFGVAGGNGLVAMEQHAADVEAMTGVTVHVAGFDTGEGLYEPTDYRDMPYFFKGGNYRMDVERLRRRLTRAQLWLGDAGETFERFLATAPAPIGAISFDMDYYSATAAVLTHMGDTAPHDAFLPRVPCYFDDVVGKRGRRQDYSAFTGELLAIREFNDANAGAKLDEDRSFRMLPLDYPWYHAIYTLHRFAHPLYTTYVGRHSSDTLSLADDD